MTTAARAFPALGTTASVVVTDPGRLSEAAALLSEELDAIDLACSRFRADSEISRLHEQAGRQVRVGELLAEALGAALRAARLTGGLVDPTVGAAVRALGYDRDFALISGGAADPARPTAALGGDRPGSVWPGGGMPDPAGGVRGAGGPAASAAAASPGAAGTAALGGDRPGSGWPGGGMADPAGGVRGAVRPVHATPAPGWHRVLFDPALRLVVLPRGVQLDLGATAKALAADRAAGRIHAALGCGVLVNLGGDLRVAGPEPTGGWQVALGDDHADAVARPDGQVALTAGGLATSGTARRRWRHAGRTVHHIVDPRTGDVAEPLWRTVSVAAKSTVDANTASTAAVVLGADAPGWLAARRLPARLTSDAGDVVTTPGWPAERRAA
ncbi:FAD:protein FMN transferase [Amycolatopsis sp. NBRC 101858]|uniref:FAD:protein FMN transferase n=1 Tax=Amycolatopsis sp. NBRC 101858 TaxID=3032200 RepID=UPI0024A36E24|nr:FAD:protein FMN transferase [Amycolatopsis sp. NBRC 101858]GLY38595.1 FAD:protein FMN transferase [Amycolatopsis sp. NBRC 101858]